MRSQPSVRVVALVVAVAFAGCSERGITLVSPAGPTGTPGITINSAGARVFLGSTETFTATLVSSTGASSPITTGSWSTDASSVLSVTPSGVVTGLTSGDATVFVDFQGQRGSKKITVIPNYGGDFPGNYTVKTCTQSEGWVPGDFCTTTFIVNSTLPYEIVMTYMSVTDVQGQTALGQLVSNTFRATVLSNGTLPITARYVSGTLTGDQSWLLNSTTPGRITGTMSVTFRDSTLAGELAVTGTLVGTPAQADSTGDRPLRLQPRSLEWPGLARGIRLR